MAFLDGLKEMITDKSKVAADKAKNVAGVLQLKSKLSAEKDKVNKAYAAMGKAFYEAHKEEGCEDFAESFAEIGESLAKITELEDAILELEGNRVCPECGAKVDKDALFCKKCGAPMPVAKEEEAFADAEEAVEEAAEEAAQEAGDIAEEVKAAAEGAVEEAKEKAADIAEAAGEAAADAQEEVKAVVDEVADAVKEIVE